MSELTESFSKMLVLYKDIDPKMEKTDEDYVKEFHRVLDEVESKIGSEIFHPSRFAISDDELKSVIVDGNFATNEWNYSDKRFCDTKLLLTKIEAALDSIKANANEYESSQMNYRG